MKKKKREREEKETTVSAEQRSTVFGSGYLWPSKAPLLERSRDRAPAVAAVGGDNDARVRRISRSRFIAKLLDKVLILYVAAR